MLKHGMAYVAQGLAAYETAYRERVVRQVKRKAAELGLVVVERDAVSATVVRRIGRSWREARPSH